MNNLNTETQDESSATKYVLAGGVGFVLGAGTAYSLDLGPGGAELVPAAGALVGVISLKVGEIIENGWDKLRVVAGWD